MAELHIYNIDEATKVMLKEQAARKGISVNKYIQIILNDYMVATETRNLDEKYRNLVKDVLSMYNNLLEESKRVIEENSYYLAKNIAREDK
ncbi:MAG: hypothetical protein KH297_04770 [Firmicutes bacterium]|nr:hypothetical protein [Bacillota bacterium]